MSSRAAFPPATTPARATASARPSADPISDTVKYRATVSYLDTDGYIDNPFLGEEADPYEDLSARGLLVWEPNDGFRADLRAYISDVSTQALYFNITESVNDTSLPVRVNNPGINDRELSGASLKLDWSSSFGTITSVTAYDKLEEILTGDQFNFLPIPESVLFQFFLADQAQHQFLDVDAVSQELRFTSPADRSRALDFRRVRDLDRSLHLDRQRHRHRRRHRARSAPHAVGRSSTSPTNCFPPACRQFTYLADSQDNFAWAVFGDLSFDITDRLEGSVALRYDEDERENTTETPANFLPTPTSFPGQVRKNTWDELQPKVTLRYKPADDRTLYIGYSRGFRSGGFNQTGVGAANIAGISDLFDKETADTYEAGFKGEFMDRRLATNLSLYYTQANGSYFFVFDREHQHPESRQPRRRRLQGPGAGAQGRVTDSFDAYLGVGYTDSEIKESDRAATDVGNQAPLVSEYSINLGLAYRQELAAFGGASAFVRADLDVTGPTWFYPGQLHRARHDQRAESARRARQRVVVGHGMGEKPDRRGVQRRVVARSDVLPEPGLHQQFRVQGAAATLGRRPRLSILGARSWPPHANCLRGCITRRTSRRISRRPASSTRTSSACR